MITLDSLFEELNLDASGAYENECLYKTGFLDSVNLLQLLMLIEQSRVGGRICLEEILAQDITLDLLRSLLGCREDDREA